MLGFRPEWERSSGAIRIYRSECWRCSDSDSDSRDPNFESNFKLSSSSSFDSVHPAKASEVTCRRASLLLPSPCSLSLSFYLPFHSFYLAALLHPPMTSPASATTPKLFLLLHQATKHSDLPLHQSCELLSFYPSNASALSYYLPPPFATTAATHSAATLQQTIFLIQFNSIRFNSIQLKPNPTRLNRSNPNRSGDPMKLIFNHIREQSRIDAFEQPPCLCNQPTRCL